MMATQINEAGKYNEIDTS